MLGMDTPKAPAPNKTRTALGARTTHLYGAYTHDGWDRLQRGVDDTPIYVGISDKPRRRWRQHTADKPWANEVAHWRVIATYPTRHAAKTAETWWITTRPTRWNEDETLPRTTRWTLAARLRRRRRTQPETTTGPKTRNY